MLGEFYTDVFIYGQGLAGPNNIAFVARRLWTYLNPPALRPFGFTDQRRWVRRKQIRAWMNSGFYRSLNFNDALLKS